MQSEASHNESASRVISRLIPLKLLENLHMSDSFPALPGFYRLVFLYLEPCMSYNNPALTN